MIEFKKQSQTAIDLASKDVDKAIFLAEKIDDQYFRDLTLYKIAKLIILKDKRKSIEISNKLSLLYKYGIWTYEDSLNKDEESIDNRIILFKGGTQVDWYKHSLTLIEIGRSIVDNYPFKALDIIHFFEEIYEYTKCHPENILELSVETVSSFGKNIDIKTALKYMDEIIEIDIYKLEAVESLLKLDISKEEEKELLLIHDKIKTNIVE